MKMKELFDRGEFVVSAEVGPPKGIHVEELVEEAKTYLKGVHAVNVTDNQSSVMRLGSLAMCKVLKDAGMDPIFQLACRDRNRIALESDLLSAAMFGIENILCLTGDHTKMGDHPQAKPVFDLDSVSLLHTVKLLESGVDLGGNQLVGEPPKFSKGAVVSPAVIPLMHSLQRWREKWLQVLITSRPRLFLSRRNLLSSWRKQNSSENRYRLVSLFRNLPEWQNS